MRAVLALAVLLASAPGYAFAPRKLGSAAGKPATQTAGKITRIAGGPIDAPGAVDDGAIAEREARAFLAARIAQLAPGATAADFIVIGNSRDGELRTVGFRQTYRGMRVVGAQLAVVFGRGPRGDRLFAVLDGAKPNVTPAVPTTRAAYSAMRGRVEAWMLADTALTTAATPTGERVVVETSGGYRVADVLDVASTTSPDRWDVYVAADGTPLARDSKIMFATGTLKYNAGLRHANGARDDLAVGNAAITVNSLATTTAANGSFSWTGSSAATVTPGLSGPDVRIINQAGALATGSLPVQPGQSAVWNLSSDELSDAQLSTFIYATVAKAQARIVNPALAPWLDQQLDFFVNESGECNAYSTGNDVHFFRSSTTCQNTGRVGDIVFHEFGHSVHSHTVIPGAGGDSDGHLGEGLADFFAANITDDPAVGRGMYYDDSPLRHIDPSGYERVYPIDVDFDPHITGLIISGTLWDLRKLLVAGLGAAQGRQQIDRIFTGVMARSSDLPKTFEAALIADDDDADLDNGTPNYCAIERAFGRHGLVDGYRGTTVSTPAVDGRKLTLTVDTPTDTACPAMTVTRISVAWQVGDGVPSVFELVAEGSTWTGELPALPDGTVVSYSVEVEYDDGTTQAFPTNAADPLYQLMLGEPKRVWCESFDADPNWEQSSNVGFEWQWGMPQASGPGGDPASAYSGGGVFGTDVSSDGRYRANLVSAAYSPLIDVGSFDQVHLQYRRWLTVEDATYDQASISANDTEVWRNKQAQNGGLDHVDREWRLHDIDVTPYVRDGMLQIKWSLQTDGSKQLGGWNLDDVCIVALTKIARCGDGYLDVGEQCDDGNLLDDDGCTRECVDMIESGGGGCCSASGGEGSILLTLGVIAIAGRRRRPL
ncbi:MAG: DUF4215 domain-containing protein [Kofleriaceae bacterium]|nr:DUF4215 domain-containing protein [Kofleriaceae bacterium]